MEIYKCKKCGSFLASIDKNTMNFKAKKGINIEEDKIILKCKCGRNTVIPRDK